jgi:hypothetical protein
MDMLFAIMLIAIIAALLAARPAPPPPIVYVPLAPDEAPTGTIGCMPLILLGILLILALGAIRL